jgi:hypothetical protein
LWAFGLASVRIMSFVFPFVDFLNSSNVVVPEWLSGMTRNHVGSARAGSNPADHDFGFCIFRLLSTYIYFLKRKISNIKISFHYFSKTKYTSCIRSLKETYKTATTLASSHTNQKTARNREETYSLIISNKTK